MKEENKANENTSDKPLEFVSRALSNLRHEKFARAVLEFNGNPKKCLEEAGYAYKGNSSYYSQLKAKPKIAQRISELIQEQSKGKVAPLTERLTMLTEIARDVTQTKTIRIKALSELHRQSGDDVQKLDVNNNSVVTYTEIELPKQNIDSEDADTDDVDLDDFINDLEL